VFYSLSFTPCYRILWLIQLIISAACNPNITQQNIGPSLFGTTPSSCSSRPRVPQKRTFWYSWRRAFYSGGYRGGAGGPCPLKAHVR